MSDVEDKIAEIISSNEPAAAAKVMLDVMRNIAKGDPFIMDDPDHSINREIDHACEKYFG